jgi:hypothetical protein
MFRSLLVIALWAAPAGAQTIYRWTDARGTVHYTDDRSTAPKGVKVETTEGEELTDIETPKPQARPRKFAAAPNDVTPMPVPPPPDPVQRYEPAPQRRDTREEETYWRNAFHDVRERIRELETEIAADEKIVGDPTQLPMNGRYYCAPWVNWAQNPNRPANVEAGMYPYGSCWYQMNNEFERTKRRLTENKAALGRAKEDLTDHERRAANSAVPLEWRR